MRESFVKKSSNAFFEGKNAKVLNDISNIGKETIKAGTTVIIEGKNCRNRLYLNVKHGKIYINGVAPSDLELLKESETSWPIESDTMDLREYEFNIIK